MNKEELSKELTKWAVFWGGYNARKATDMLRELEVHEKDEVVEPAYRTIAVVDRRIWSPGDTYRVVEIQVPERFNVGEQVHVTLTPYIQGGG